MILARGLRLLLLTFRVTVGAIGLGILLVAMWLLAFATAAPLSLGWTPVLIISNSMEPSISEGDVILVDEEATIGIGSVVTFESADDGRLITHRVVGLDDEGNFLTRGDANLTNDSTPVTPDMIVGQAKILVPMAGLPWLWFSDERWLTLAAALAVLFVSAAVARWALETTGHEGERAVLEPSPESPASPGLTADPEPEPTDIRQPPIDLSSNGAPANPASAVPAPSKRSSSPVL